MEDIVADFDPAGLEEPWPGGNEVEEVSPVGLALGSVGSDTLVLDAFLPDALQGVLLYCAEDPTDLDESFDDGFEAEGTERELPDKSESTDLSPAGSKNNFYYFVDKKEPGL